MQIETERLVLRDFQVGDFEAFYATTSDSDYRQFYSEREMQRGFWEELFERIRMKGDETERTSFQLAVCLHSGELIGTCGVRMEDIEHRQASYGCAIGAAYWRKGYAFEASHRIIAYGFENLPIHRLYAETNRENVRARGLAQRLGFRLEGELRQTKFFRGRWWDTVIYAMLKEEWQG
jgi:RimJ/RimL family protein N-acetyltransferase